MAQHSEMMTLFDPDEDQGPVKSLAKALTILEAIAMLEQPSTAEIAVSLGISRPTVHRIVQTLVAHGYVDQDPHTGRLSIGYAVLPLSASQLDANRLRLEALPHLFALSAETGERSNLGVLYRNRILYLAGVEKPRLPQIYTRFGRTAPAHCCSLGKAILANSPDTVVNALFEKEPLVAQTDKSITDIDVLRKDLAEAHRRGIAVDQEEHVAGSFCIAAPIFDSRMRCVAAISLSGRALEPLLAYSKLLTQTAEQISHVL